MASQSRRWGTRGLQDNRIEGCHGCTWVEHSRHHGERRNGDHGERHEVRHEERGAGDTQGRGTGLGVRRQEPERLLVRCQGVSVRGRGRGVGSRGIRCRGVRGLMIRRRQGKINEEHKVGELGSGHQGWHQPWVLPRPRRPQ
jgi:hypothetical protein